MNTVLIVGATGVVGDAALGYFSAIDNFNVIALSRRSPEFVSQDKFQHLAVDLFDSNACEEACASLGMVTHVIYAAVSEKPGLYAGWLDTEQMALNLRMLKNLMEPLSRTATGLRHITLLQGTKAYGGHAGFTVPMPARESAARVSHDNFYWLQEDYIRTRAQQDGFGWTIFRPQVIVGAAWGAAMNPLLPLAVYAAICKEQDKPFGFPGGAMQIGELVDASLLAEACHWAGMSGAARGETFNITNGDVFAWREAWPEIAQALGVQPGPDEPVSLAEYLLDHSAIWDRIVERENLLPLPLKAFLGESHHYADILLRRDVETLQRPALVSTIKLRQAGFSGCRDSVVSVLNWIDELKRRRLIPG